MAYESERVAINIDRMKEKFLKLAQIGATENGGLSRLALSEADKQARDMYIQWMKGAGLTVTYDDGGNLYGYREGTQPELPAIFMGSHIDTVFKGGKFDGITGSMGALEVMDALHANNIKTKRSMGIAIFTNEEGARFKPALLGSGLLTGFFTKEFVYSQQDLDGKVFGEELAKIGYVGEEKNRIKPPRAFLELHVEQGPVLDAEKLSIGVVEGIIAMTWYQVVVHGQSNQAGPTPMSMRRDAVAAAAKIITKVQEIAGILGHDSVTTVGQITVEPNIVNVIPAKVTFSVDIRNASTEIMDEGIVLLKQAVEEVSRQEKVECEVNKLWRVAAVPFDQYLVNTVESQVKELGYPYKRMSSAAGHDSQYMAQWVPTAMIFVPSINGRSHTESEQTSWTDMEHGVQVLFNTALKLANN